jgi:hypothetical protein
MNELEFEMINLQRNLSLKARIDDTNIRNLLFYSKVSVIEGEWVTVLLKRIWACKKDFFFFGATARIWALAYLHETLRFTSVF